VHETDEKYLVNVDLPGINKEDIHVSMENGILSQELKKLEKSEPNRLKVKVN
jgi:HSP20 family molecular chaperone IbpA